MFYHIHINMLQLRRLVATDHCSRLCFISCTEKPADHFKDGLQPWLWRQNQVLDFVLTFLRRIRGDKNKYFKVTTRNFQFLVILAVRHRCCCRKDVLLFVLEASDRKMNRDEVMMIRLDPSGNNNQQMVSFAVPGRLYSSTWSSPKPNLLVLCALS